MHTKYKIKFMRLLKLFFMYAHLFFKGKLIIAYAILIILFKHLLLNVFTFIIFLQALLLILVRKNNLFCTHCELTCNQLKNKINIVLLQCRNNIQI